jgi:hypothetical protein
MFQDNKGKLVISDSKRKVTTHTIERKYQPITDVKKGIGSKATIAKKYRNELLFSIQMLCYTCTH